jgi:flagellar basal-body rod protein FlgG
MIRGTYASTAGMVAQLSRVENISNNLANVDTTGYKEDTLRLSTFPELLLSRLMGGETQGGQAVNPTIGTGPLSMVAESSVVRLTQGALKPTENPLDMAVQGTAFFAVQTPDGVRYTRDGSFQRDAAGQLVTSQGFGVLGPGGQPITLPQGQVVVTPEGALLVDGAAAGQLGLFDFADPAQLRKAAGNLFEDAGEAGPAAAAGSTVHQGYLEGSNVDPTRAMADLIVAQRSYETNARCRTR